MSPIDDIATVGFASRTSGARPKWRECAENHAVFQCCQESVPASPVQASAKRMAWIFRSGISKAIDLRRKIPARALFSGVRARKQVCGLLCTTASSPTAHRQRPVELGAADRSKPNLTKWQNKIPTRVSFLCLSAPNVRRGAAAAPCCRGRSGRSALAALGYVAGGAVR